MVTLDLLDDPEGPRRVHAVRADALIGAGGDVDPMGPGRCRLHASTEGLVVEPVGDERVQISHASEWHTLTGATTWMVGECLSFGHRRVQLVAVESMSALAGAAGVMTSVDPVRALVATAPLNDAETNATVMAPADWHTSLARSPLLAGCEWTTALTIGGTTLAATVRSNGSLLDAEDDRAPPPISEDDLWVSDNHLAETVRLPLDGTMPGDISPDATAMDGPSRASAVDSCPRFVLPSGAIDGPRIDIGRAASADLVLPDPAVDGQHAEVTFADGRFTLREVGAGGVYFGDARITDHAIADGDQLRVGPFVLAFAVDGARCRIIVGQPAGLTRPTAAVAQSIAAVSLASPFATLLRRAVPDGAGGPDVFRRARARLAPEWRAPGDTLPPPWRRRALGAMAMLLGAWGLSAIGHDGSVSPRETAPAHSSPQFTRAAEAIQRGGCSSCHGAGPSADRCVDCHADHTPRAIADEAGLAEPHESADCVDCHTEHPGDGEPQLALVATAHCAGCHPVDGDRPRHASLLQGGTHAERSPVTRTDAAPLAGLGTEALHALHRGVDRACFACHPDDAPPVAVERSLCLDCHGGPEALEMPCATCHLEHRAPLTRRGPFLALADGFEIPPAESAEPSGGTDTPSGSTGGSSSELWLSALPFIALVLPLIGAIRRREVTGIVADAESADVPESSGDWSRKKQIHIEPDLCVACAACIETCPYHVLDLRTLTYDSKAVGVPVTRGIAQVVDFDRCQQEAFCEVECPTGALRRAFGELELVPAPAVDRHFETALPGVYLAGAVSGVELVKNALNLGHRCLAHATEHGLRPGGPRTVDGLEAYDVFIAGAGPAGLSAATTAAHLGLRHLVVEKGPGITGMLTDNFPPDKPVQLNPAEVGNISRMWLPPSSEITWRALRARWEADFATTTPLRETRFGATMTGFERCADGYLVHVGDDRVFARRIVVAIGVKSNYNKLGRSTFLPGEQTPKVKRAMIDPAPYRGQRCAVVGCGNAGVECALALAAGGAAEVTLINHRPTFQVGGRGGMTPENHARLLQLMASSGGRFRAWHQTNTVAIEPDVVRLTHGDDACEQRGPDDRVPLGIAESRLPNDVVFAMIGARPPLRWLEGLGVELTERPADWFPEPTDVTD